MEPLFHWITDPSHMTDRRVQACCVVLFSMGMITWAAYQNNSSAITERIVDWSFVTLLATVGIFHAARGIEEIFRIQVDPEGDSVNSPDGGSSGGDHRTGSHG